MDPVSVGLLAALAGGAGGEIGRQAWAGLSALVRRPLRGGQDAEDVDDVAAVSSGEVELAELERAPADSARAQALSTALAVRAAVDADFHAGLERWRELARLVRTGDGEARNTISGGTFHGPVLQGRDFSGTSFTTPPPPPAGSDTPSTQD
ncbi:hypothetical protein [Allostreptomyces psammosilenae]|uniref:Uncharacterized protein n=1 Tax=Allostreptomyces psammosilenae TaxID=1892865 RepID=A0A853A021_9ACTN|nr:hypothetical protein [Allostreptomyces psammosilenae]NYI03862.1 hypothetical protein [Allostreptomyces psammosilenae]